MMRRRQQQQPRWTNNLLSSFPKVLVFFCGLWCHSFAATTLMASSSLSIFAILSSSLSSFGGSGVHALSASKPSLTYRTAKPTDIAGIATLLMDTFDDDTIPAWNIVQRKLTLDGYQKQMEQRLELCRGGRHALIVAVKNDDDDKNSNYNKNSNNIAGFMELGTMPSPIPIQVNTTWNDMVVEKTIQPEMPFLANLAVDKDYRRCGIGTKLVQLAVKVSTKWCATTATTDGDDNNDNDAEKNAVNDSAALYLAVEKENAAAVRLYDGLKFCRVLDETEQTWSSKKLERKLKERKPRLYFERKLSSVD